MAYNYEIGSALQVHVDGRVFEVGPKGGIIVEDEDRLYLLQLARRYDRSVTLLYGEGDYTELTGVFMTVLGCEGNELFLEFSTEIEGRRYKCI